MNPILRFLGRAAVPAVIAMAAAASTEAAEFPVTAGHVRAWTGWSELSWEMDEAWERAGRFENDGLYEASHALGQCPGWFDGFPRFLRNFDRMCGRGILLRQAEAKYKELTGCLQHFDPRQPSLSLDAVRKCKKVQDTIDQASDASAIAGGVDPATLDDETRERHEALLSSVKSLLADVAVCTIKAGITAADMPDSRRRDWENFVDGARVLESGIDVVDTYYSLVCSEVGHACAIRTD